MSASERYLHGHHESVLRSHSWRTVENSAAYLVPYLTPGADLLDVGSGPGTITLDLARRLRPGRVVGVDASPDVVAQATALAADAEAANVSFEVGDAYGLDFPDASFDIVHAHQVLQHLARPVHALREWRRVLKPGGILAVRDVVYRATVWAPANPGLDRWLDAYLASARSTGGEPDAGASLKAWAREAGFEGIECTASVWCFASDVEREWWGGSWADRVLKSSFAVQTIEAGAADLADLEGMAAGWASWRDDPDGWLAMTHGEVIARRPLDD